MNQIVYIMIRTFHTKKGEEKKGNEMLSFFLKIFYLYDKI